MPATLPLRPGDSSTTHDLPATYRIAHEIRLVLRVFTVILLIATIATMATFWFWAIVPAAALLAVVTLHILAIAAERAAAKSGGVVIEPPDPDASPADRPLVQRLVADLSPVQRGLIRRGSRVMVVILAAAGIIGFTIAAFFTFDPMLVVAVGLGLFGYILVVSMPVWLAGLEDDLEVERDRLEHEDDVVA
ncbi:MAG: hypothetical protein KDA25_03030 [Phycisphaerales bacterium]|nr:hypothetical protein [Phycisphaerales bacterium]